MTDFKENLDHVEKEVNLVKLEIQGIQDEPVVKDQGEEMVQRVQLENLEHLVSKVYLD